MAYPASMNCERLGTAATGAFVAGMIAVVVALGLQSWQSDNWDAPSWPWIAMAVVAVVLLVCAALLELVRWLTGE